MADKTKSYTVTYKYRNKGASTLRTTVTATSRMDARGKVLERNTAHPVTIISVTER